ncbi:MAG TPA: DinB family protein [Thermoanaerobaculia bacterium]|nr:DinB family protein [Thermoanaerobaculia bacterium]
MRDIPKPPPGEYPAYASMYIDLLPGDGRLLDHLERARVATTDLVLGLPEETLLHRYAPGKWTIKEILVHIVDDERIYAYRALRFARGDLTPLPGFEQDAFAAASQANERQAADIVAEYAAVREATIALFRGLPQAALLRSGVADGKRSTVRALGYHIAGHEAHHVAFVEERYLGRKRIRTS